MSFLKKILLPLCFIYSCVSAQNHYFNNNPIWQFHSQCAINYPCIEDRSYTYYVNGDTVINNLTYIKLFTRGNGFYYLLGPSPFPCTGSFVFNDTINPAALLRDSLQKIYIYTANNGEELLYDFSLNAGDTIPATMVTYHAVVTSMDSIQIGPFYRKRLHFMDLNNQPQVLLEGIGHPNGFLEMVYPILECGRDLICYGFQDSSYYPFTGMNCSITEGINKYSKSKNFVVFPNPSNDVLYINNPSDIKEFSIFNAMGKQISVPYEFDELLKVNVSDLSKGSYCIKILTTYGYATKKFIKTE